MVFEDGEEVEADVVMCCTGYQDRFEFLSEELGSDRINVRTLFKHSVHPDYDNLALIGWARPASGGIPACSELQVCISRCRGEEEDDIGNRAPSVVRR